MNGMDKQLTIKFQEKELFLFAMDWPTNLFTNVKWKNGKMVSQKELLKWKK